MTPCGAVPTTSGRPDGTNRAPRRANTSIVPAAPFPTTTRPPATPTPVGAKGSDVQVGDPSATSVHTRPRPAFAVTATGAAPAEAAMVVVPVSGCAVSGARVSGESC